MELPSVKRINHIVCFGRLIARERGERHYEWLVITKQYCGQPHRQGLSLECHHSMLRTLPVFNGYSFEFRTHLSYSFPAIHLKKKKHL